MRHPNSCDHHPQLVQRFYDPQQGRVLFDGVPLPQIDNVFLHQSVALVAQEPLVFADSIKSNILFGVHRTNVTQVGIRASTLGCVGCMSCACGLIGTQ
jgi:ABC-type multidrug transport system fused ATPase/permease subunit